MHILRLVRSVDLRHGGPVETLYQVSRELERQGHQVTIASLDCPGSSCVKDFGLPVKALGTNSSHYGYTSRLVPFLRRRASGVDAVVVSGLWQYQTFGAWRALKKGPAPYFIYPHGMLDPWFKRSAPLKHVKKWLYWPWAEHRALRDARAVFFTCEEERRLARESFWLYRCEEVVVNYGTAAPTGDAATQRELFLSNWPELRNSRIFLFLGRIHQKKGCDLLIRAFAKFKRAIPEKMEGKEGLRLVMAGPGEPGLVNQLKRLSERLGIANQVLWPGMLKGDLKWGAMRSAEVFILPSHQENFGVAVAEALACGVPALISDQVNIWREVVHHQAGIAAPDTEAGTFELLQRWCNLSSDNRDVYRVRAIQCYEKMFSVGQAARSMVNEVESRLRLRHRVKPSAIRV